MAQDTLTLKSLYQSIQAQIASGNGTFNLVPDVLTTNDKIGSFYTGIIDGTDFTISNAALQPDKWDDTLIEFTLTGNSSSIGGVAMQTSFVFSDSDVGVSSDLTATQNNGTWEIDGITWFSLSNPFIGVLVYDSDTSVVGFIGGTINTGVSLTVKMSYPVVNNSWLLQGSFNAPLPNISNFYQLVGGVNLRDA